MSELALTNDIKYFEFTFAGAPKRVPLVRNLLEA